MRFLIQVVSGFVAGVGTYLVISDPVSMVGPPALVLGAAVGIAASK